MCNRLTVGNFEGGLCCIEAAVDHPLKDRLERRIVQLSELQVVAEVDQVCDCAFNRSETSCETN